MRQNANKFFFIVTCDCGSIKMEVSEKQRECSLCGVCNGL